MAPQGEGCGWGYIWVVDMTALADGCCWGLYTGGSAVTCGLAVLAFRAHSGDGLRGPCPRGRWGFPFSL